MNNKHVIVINLNQFPQILYFSAYFVISVFEAYINGTLGAVTKFYIIFLSIYFLFKSKKAALLNPISVPFIMWFLYKCLSLLWSSDYSTPLLHITSELGMILFLSVLSSHSMEKIVIDKSINVYFYSSLVLATLCVLFSKAYRGVITSRQVVSIFGVEQDPNNIGALILIGFSIALFRIFYVKKTSASVKNVLFTFIFVLGGLKTGSRATLVTMIITMVLVFFTFQKNKIKSLIIMVITVAISSFLVYRYLPNEVFTRLFVSDYGNGSGRIEMWSNVWRAYSKNIITILFGIGWGSATINTGISLAVHNTFLTMICDVGLVGVILFFAPIVKMMSYLKEKEVYLPLFLMISQFIPAFFLDSINKRFFWNAIFILIIYTVYYVELDRTDEHT